MSYNLRDAIRKTKNLYLVYFSSVFVFTSRLNSLLFSLIMERRIVCAALRSGGQIICGVRHFDAIMRAAIKTSPLKWGVHAEQGFVDNTGSYLSRKDAWVVASDANQVLRVVGGNESRELYSENLY